jgi:hypothetical protein
MIKQKLPYILYMEDDANLFMSFQNDRLVSPSPQCPTLFRTRLSHILDQLQHVSWDVVRLGGIFSSGCEQLLGTWEHGLTFCKTGFCLGGHGLLLSQRAAKTMLQHAFPIKTTIDHALLLSARTSGLLDFEVIPHIIGQDILIRPSESLIGYSLYEEISLKAFLKFNISPAFFMTMILHLNELEKILLPFVEHPLLVTFRRFFDNLCLKLKRVNREKRAPDRLKN